MGVETQRQWSDKAIARSTPALMGIFLLVSLMATAILDGKELEKAEAAWYYKDQGTFSDVLTLVRKALWRWNYYNGFAEKDTNPGKEELEKDDWLIDMLGMAV